MQVGLRDVRDDLEAEGGARVVLGAPQPAVRGVRHPFRLGLAGTYDRLDRGQVQRKARTLPLGVGVVEEAARVINPGSGGSD